MKIEITTDGQGSLVFKSDTAHAVLRGMPSEIPALADVMVGLKNATSQLAHNLARNAERLNEKFQLDEARKGVVGDLSKAFVRGVEAVQEAKREVAATDARVADFNTPDPAMVAMWPEQRNWLRALPKVDQLNFLLTGTVEQLAPFMLPGVREMLGFKDDEAWGRVSDRYRTLMHTKYVRRIAQPKKSSLEDIAPVTLDFEANMEIVEAAIDQRNARIGEIESVEMLLKNYVAVVAATLSVELREAWDLLNASRS